MRNRCWTGLVALVAMASCGGTALDRGVEKFVTIEQGLFGQVTSVDDVGTDQAPHALADFQVDLFAAPTGTDLGTPISTTKSTATGFFELGAAPGEYVICSSFRRCVRLTVGAGQERVDYEFSVGPGWSRGTRWPAQ